MYGCPTDLSSVDDKELIDLEKSLTSLKREKMREIDHINTELIGIKEELLKRREILLKNWSNEKEELRKR